MPCVCYASRMDEATRKRMASSKNEHWNTPDTVLIPIYTNFGEIALDPCSNPTSIIKCGRTFNGVEVDGLKESWQCGGLVFVNPPYGKLIKPWIAKAVRTAEEARKLSTGTEIIVLGPARTDTAFFQKLVLPTADSICFWRGRITFLGAPHGAFFPSFLGYWGHRTGVFRQTFSQFGYTT